MTLAERIRTRLSQGFPLLTDAERELLAEVFEDVHRVSRAEGMLAALDVVKPYVTPQLRAACAVSVAAAAMRLAEPEGPRLRVVK